MKACGPAPESWFEVRQSALPYANEGLWLNAPGVRQGEVVFKEGSIILPYRGERIDEEEHNKRLSDPEYQAYAVSFFDSENTFLDGRGQIAAKANDAGIGDHDKANNAEITILFVKDGRKGLQMEAFLYATDEIKNGEEIFVNYGTDYWTYIEKRDGKKLTRNQNRREGDLGAMEDDNLAPDEDSEIDEPADAEEAPAAPAGPPDNGAQAKQAKKKGKEKGKQAAKNIKEDEPKGPKGAKQPDKPAFAPPAPPKQLSLPSGEYRDSTTRHRLYLFPPRQYRGKTIQAIYGGGRIELPEPGQGTTGRLELSALSFEVQILPDATPPEFRHDAHRHGMASKKNPNAGRGPYTSRAPTQMRFFRYRLYTPGAPESLRSASAAKPAAQDEETAALPCDWLNRNLKEKTRKSGHGGRVTLYDFLKKQHRAQKEYDPRTRQWVIRPGPLEDFCLYAKRQLSAMEEHTTAGPQSLFAILLDKYRRGLEKHRERGRWVHAGTPRKPPGARPPPPPPSPYKRRRPIPGSSLSYDSEADSGSFSSDSDSDSDSGSDSDSDWDY